MQKLLVISDDSKELLWFWETPSLQDCQIETVGEDADVLPLLRRRDFDIVVSSPTTQVKSDFVRLSEMLRIRPGLRLILLCPGNYADGLDRGLARSRLRLFQRAYKTDEVMAMIGRAFEERDWKDASRVEFRIARSGQRSAHHRFQGDPAQRDRTRRVVLEASQEAMTMRLRNFVD